MESLTEVEAHLAPPMVLRPRPGTSQKIVDEKTVITSYFLDQCQFKREVKWGLEQLAHLGTGIWKWGIERVEKEIPRRKSSDVNIEGGQGLSEKISLDEDPKIEITKKVVSKPFFEFRPLSRVLIDPSLKVGDIREAGYVIDVRYMDFYQLQDLKNQNSVDGKPMEGWTWDEYYSDEKLKELWIPPVEALETPGPLRTDQQSQTVGVVHHGEEDVYETSADPLAKKLEVLEYWDRRRKILVLNRKKSIYTRRKQIQEDVFLVRQLVEPPEGVLWHGYWIDCRTKPARRSGHDQRDSEDSQLRGQSCLFAEPGQQCSDANDSYQHW